MEKWIGESENLIKASEAGMASSIKRRRDELKYRIELESIILDIYNDYSEDEVERDCSNAVQIAWRVGEQLAERPKQCGAE